MKHQLDLPVSDLSHTTGGLGATYLGHDRCQFVVWAPHAKKIELQIIAPRHRVVPLSRDANGYHRALVEDVEIGSLYVYKLDGHKDRPDPASRFQPYGVHGPSQVVETDFPWSDGLWSGLPLQQCIIYELHVGAFTAEGIFEAIVPHLDALKDLGITAVELMPVAQFPGNRNWGYDGVYPFAAHDSYGGPNGFKKLVDACHGRGLAVVLDVVFNHLGPEGNYLGDYGPYFTDRYLTPWGWAINFDGPSSDEVRRFFIENALYWIKECHVDALRLDAVHAIFDRSAQPFLEELSETIHQHAVTVNRRAYVIAESDLNDARLIRAKDIGGYGLDAQWSDDLHHAIHSLLTEENTGYYQDFGTVDQLARAFRDGYAYTGQYSLHRQRRHGNSPHLCDAHQFIVCTQNHDQVGNRMQGERLCQLVSFEKLKVAAGLVLLSPFLPLVFMGEEYGETAPFQYFISHSDQQLVEAVRQGRREEFSAFMRLGEPPDPQSETTFLRAKLSHQLRRDGHHGVLLEFYKELIKLRKTIPALALLSKEHLEVLGYEDRRLLFVRRWTDDSETVLIVNLGDAQRSVPVPIPTGQWQKLLDSAEHRWHGNGSTVPEQFDAEGEKTLSLSPWSLVLCARGEGA